VDPTSLFPSSVRYAGVSRYASPLAPNHSMHCPTHHGFFRHLTRIKQQDPRFHCRLLLQTPISAAQIRCIVPAKRAPPDICKSLQRAALALTPMQITSGHLTASNRVYYPLAPRRLRPRHTTPPTHKLPLSKVHVQRAPNTQTTTVQNVRVKHRRRNITMTQ